MTYSTNNILYFVLIVFPTVTGVISFEFVTPPLSCSAHDNGRYEITPFLPQFSHVFAYKTIGVKNLQIIRKQLPCSIVSNIKDFVSYW